MKKEVGKVRPSQFITTFGPGSIVDLPDFSVIMGGINKWEDYTTLKYSFDIEEDRLKRKLRINKIKSIPVTTDSKGIGTLPAYRFPEFHVCPNCRRLGSGGNVFTEIEGVLYCQNRHLEGKPSCEKIKTHPVRFLTACKNGHIDDFPWGFYVHNKGNKYDPSKCRLYLEDSGTSGSLKDLIVTCTTCEVKKSMNDAFNEKALPKCSGRRPWLGAHNRDEEACEADRKVLMRGASNLYFPIIESSIVIPYNSDDPFEDLVSKEIDFDNEELLNDFNEFKTAVKYNKNLKHYDPEKLWISAQKLLNGDSSEEDLLFPEWEMIQSGSSPIDARDFELEIQETPQKFSGLLSKLVRVKRLKEVMVLKGFTRIQPVPDATMRLSGEQASDTENNQMKIAHIADTNLDWLPGVESFGEGVFISLNETVLKKWESENSPLDSELKNAHINQFKERNVPEEGIPPFPGIRYVLLHTLSHALMRELCLHSGYSSSALKERIYSNPEKGMAGILVYTATVDSEGSLGGLVELGKTHNFESILARALSAAKYCSGDPLCAEKHSFENLQDINGAACHSCLLMPETSCEKSNRYLDRSTLVSTVANLNREFFRNHE
ncbi:DUF1998 domain-containing protein [Jeotgalibacillus sp. R-1-5s-1]|uniref:DUF1998 domain-containing protein n=1 Tax=Jeotgalibacillus sp. R-1-5s-1 TaxID=2555897 RepID=UPI00106C51E7|nr:DUF1998 domain-containing protein [Jeotgalibacillus sp. R-1-5s-1]TFD99518.1 DUF1998 domain-containing protein [Jeotgalibacillus sp. R-1-5s-1]